MDASQVLAAGILALWCCVIIALKWQERRSRQRDNLDDDWVEKD